MGEASRNAVRLGGQLGRAVAQVLEKRVLLSTTWTVTSTADDGSPETLRYAVDNSGAGDTIQFAPELTASNAVGITLTGTPLAISHAVTIVGPGSDRLTITAGQQFSIINASADTSISGVALLGGLATNGGIINATIGKLTLNNVSIAGGKATNRGGAIYAATNSLTMTNVEIQSSSAVQGGALYLASGSATLTGVTFSLNSAASDTTPRGGAMVMVAGTTATITGSTLAQNSVTASNGASGLGGGVYNSGNLTVQNSSVGGNFTSGAESTSPGGAIYSTGTLTLTNDLLEGNHSIGHSGGGAVWCTASAPATVTGCEFDGNHATDILGSGGNGGALYSAGSLSIINSTFNGNSSGTGGALYTAGNLSIANSTFTANSAVQAGAGALCLVCVLPLTASVNNCTLVGNSAAALGGGISFFGSASFRFNNNIVTANHTGSASNEDDIQTSIAYGGHNLVGASEPKQYVNGENENIYGVVDPQLAPLASVNGSLVKVMVPLTGSPIINTGSNFGAVDGNSQSLTTDEIGQARVINGVVDIGAVEYTLPLNTINGSPFNDQITLTQDADAQHIDWTSGEASSKLSINDPTGLTINGNGGNDFIVLNYAHGNPLPNKLTLNGTFTFNNLPYAGNPLAGTTLDIKTSTVFIAYYGPTSNPLSLIKGYLKNGFNGGAWTGVATASTGSIRSSAAAANTTEYAVGFGDSADPLNPIKLLQGTIELRYTVIGDTNLDGTVGGADYAAVVQNYNTGTNWDQGDVTYETKTGGADYAAVVQHYGHTAASPAPVPTIAGVVASSLTTTTPADSHAASTRSLDWSSQPTSDEQGSKPKRIGAGNAKKHRH